MAEIYAIRHLEDINDLNYGLNAPLKPDQEKIIKDLSYLVGQRIKENGKNGGIIYCSPKERCVKTAELIKKNIRQKRPNVNIFICKDPKIRELNQGKLDLPKDYKSGDVFNPLQYAWEAFVDETFGPSKNPRYKFGEKLPNGSDSDFSRSFKSPGESCAEFHSRIYEAVQQYGLKTHSTKYEPFILTHSAIIAIMKELEFVAKDIQKGKSFIPGDLIQLTWEKAIHLDKDKYKKFGFIEKLNPNYLNNRKVLGLLEREINYLNNEK